MIEMTLPDMTCQHCVKTVTAAVRQVDPVAKVDIDLPTHCLRIDSTLPGSLFKDALTEEGYAPA